MEKGDAQVRGVGPVGAGMDDQGVELRTDSHMNDTSIY